MIILMISVKARSNKRNELLSTLRTITDQTRQEEGCEGYRVSLDIDSEDLIYLEESWERRSYLDAHFHSDIFSALLGSVKFLGENHAIQINECSTIGGVEAIQEARQRKNREISE